MLLGVDGVCIITHGSSRRDGDASTASSVADEMVERGVVAEIRDAIAADA